MKIFSFFGYSGRRVRGVAGGVKACVVFDGGRE